MSIKKIEDGLWEAELITCPRFVQLRCTKDKLEYAVIEFRRGVEGELDISWVQEREEACIKIWDLIRAG